MAASNPFAARFLRPGVVPFLFADGQSAAVLVERLRTSDWWGQIIGPHGTGKSSLLVALIPELERAGRQPELVTLHQGEHGLPRLEISDFTSGTQVIVDGYEQLHWWSRRRLKSLCRRAKCGLLATAHTDVGLPTILETSSNVDLARQVARRLLNGTSGKITDDDIAAAFEASGGNVREMLFALYDVYQRRLPDS
jgi:hypothetical protein